MFTLTFKTVRISGVKLKKNQTNPGRISIVFALDNKRSMGLDIQLDNSSSYEMTIENFAQMFLDTHFETCTPNYKPQNNIET